jgi:chaperonin GroES
MIRPLYDRVVIRRDKEEEKIGLIVIAEVAKEKPAVGTVVAVGTGRKPDTGGRIEMDVVVGDKVTFGKYAGNEVELDAGEGVEKLVILSEAEILAILD